MILADTSAWVEYDRATGSAVARRMHQLIAEDGPLHVTEPVLMEVLAGARGEDRASQLRRLLLSRSWLAVDPVADFEAAALAYRRCRQVGVTPRGLLDCLIATVAWRNGAALLAQDVDLSRIAGVLGIELDVATAVPVVDD